MCLVDCSALVVCNRIGSLRAYVQLGSEESSEEEEEDVKVGAGEEEVCGHRLIYRNYAHDLPKSSEEETSSEEEEEEKPKLLFRPKFVPKCVYPAGIPHFCSC